MELGILKDGGRAASWGEVEVARLLGLLFPNPVGWSENHYRDMFGSTGSGWRLCRLVALFREMIDRQSNLALDSIFREYFEDRARQSLLLLREWISTGQMHFSLELAVWDHAGKSPTCDLDIFGAVCSVPPELRVSGQEPPPGFRAGPLLSSAEQERFLAHARGELDAGSNQAMRFGENDFFPWARDLAGLVVAALDGTRTTENAMSKFSWEIQHWCIFISTIN